MAADVSQAELARRLGVHRPAVTRTESGQQSMAFRRLDAWAAALGLEPSSLLPARWQKEKRTAIEKSA